MSKRFLSIAIVIALFASALPAIAEVDPTTVQRRKELIHRCLINIYLNKKMRPQALAEYAIMTGLTPSDPKLRFEYGSYLAATGAPGDVAAGVSQLQKAVQLEPSNAEYNGRLGNLYLRQKKFEEALKYLRFAVQFGGEAYKKNYDETTKYIEGIKQYERQKKAQQEAIAKAKAQQAQIQQKKAGADDDDDW